MIINNMVLPFLQERARGSSLSCCREVNTRCNFAKHIEKLNKRLGDMRASSELTTLVPGAPATTYPQQPDSSCDNEIGPCSEEPDWVGSIISNDCNDLVRRMRRDSGNNISLFAIVGAPGVGKTALAQKIYHKMKGDSQFQGRMWVHISSSTGKMTIWSGENRDNAASNEEPAEQKERIRSYLRGHNLLLVIDNVRDKDGWEFLANEAEDGFLERDVRVILTASHRDRTRKIGVDKGFGWHQVRALDEDDGWLMLHKTALLKDETVRNFLFQDEGIRIVRECSGLPRALKAVGTSLRQQDKLSEWTDECCDKAYFFAKQTEIRRSIDTSYMELGYRLELCFRYCSLYPEGSVIQQKIIMQQWIAEGFFKGMASPEEEEAQKCYTELVYRSLLLPAADGCATMPNHLRSYAIYRSQDENYVGDPRSIGHEFKVWRWYATDGDTIIRNIPENFTSLRTLLVLGSSGQRGDTTSTTDDSPPPPVRAVMDVICERLPSLRVLDLRGAQVESIGSNLKELLQLRYLNLSNTSIKKLPQEVRYLVMLQYLILNNCRRLTSLPEGVGRLKNLRTLDISGTPGLRHTNFRLSELGELSCFRGFLPVPVISSRGWTFEELSNLSKVTSLQILNLGRGTSRQEAAQLRLHEMSHLKELELMCTIPAGDGRPPGGDAESIGDVLGELKPPQHLTSLKLANFYGTELPSWVSSSHLTSLERLTLEGCFQCQRLPSALGEMTHLNLLAVTGCSALREISHEFRGNPPNNQVAFRWLEQLIVTEMDSLQTWSDLRVSEGDMPLLHSFQVSRCPSMSALPPWLKHCKALTSMKIHGADKLKEIKGLPALRELQVGSCPSLEQISELGRLEDLEIGACPSLDTVEGVPLLRSLRLREDESLKELPGWLPKLAPAKPIKRLEIVGGEDLLDTCSSERATSWPSIKDIAEFVYAKVVLRDGSTSAYFSCATSTKPPRFYRISAQCRDHHDKAFGATTVQTLPPPPPPPPPEEENGGQLEEAKAWWGALYGSTPQEARAWMWRALYGLVAAFVTGSAVILSTSGTKGTIAA
jgi:hypothetical protein